MYLKEDFIGAASKIVYGLKGDIVSVIYLGLDMALVENNNLKFFIRNEKLSEEKVDPSPQIIKESTRKNKPIRKGKR